MVDFCNLFFASELDDFGFPEHLTATKLREYSSKVENRIEASGGHPSLLCLDSGCRALSGCPVENFAHYLCQSQTERCAVHNGSEW
jgi:hypothetical protein